MLRMEVVDWSAMDLMVGSQAAVFPDSRRTQVMSPKLILVMPEPPFQAAKLLQIRPNSEQTGWPTGSGTVWNAWRHSLWLSDRKRFHRNARRFLRKFGPEF